MKVDSGDTIPLLEISKGEMAISDFGVLEEKVDELIELVEALAQENRALRNQQGSWTTERAKLIENNELAKNKVEAMISRLKALEQET